MSPAIADKETRTYKLTETERRMMFARAEGVEEMETYWSKSTNFQLEQE